MALNRIPGRDNLYVGGIFALRKPDLLVEKKIDHVLSVIKYSFGGWGEEAKRFQHMSIDVDDMEDEDLLVHFSSAVRFIDRGLYPPGSTSSDDNATSPGSVFVHCAMGKSRSVSCAVAYMLYKYPHRYGGKQFEASTMSTAQRRETATEAVAQALKGVQEVRSIAEPNPGFMRQLELWWEMGCPADSNGAVESHPIYQKWLYERKLEESRAAHMAPETEWIRFEDEAPTVDASVAVRDEQKELRCKMCRRVLANYKFVIDHQGTGNSAKKNKGPCGHIFVETLSWMRPALEDGALEGRLTCPNTKCTALVGRFAWQGLRCNCGEWVCPTFSLKRSAVDESDRSAGSAIRMPPRSGNL
ncbi:tyrosine-protein phosphatase yvh1 protein [Apiospora saccharicola]|uniref:protein-tyrosine-phosphatase n=1 Tax=Apiospora saccharicola TaxID=335842 RepID=A0ABR1W2E1_9PEZI